LGKPLVTHTGPSTLQVTVNQQQKPNEDKARWIVHLLHYIPIRRSDTIDVIEDVIPLHDIDVCIRVEQSVAAARLVPDDVPVSFEQRNDEVALKIKHINGHQMVELTFEA